MRAVVCGAGIAGLTTAWCLERAGWDVLLVERAAAPSRAGFVIDFFGPGYEVADRMGLLPRLQERAADVAGLQYVDPAGRSRGRTDYAVFSAALDGRLMSIPRAELAAVLLEALGDRVPVRWGTTISDVTQADGAAGADEGDAVGVVLSDGSTERADLLVGADGLGSRTRAVVAPGVDPLRYLGFHTAAFVLDDEALRRRVGRRMVVVAAPGRQVALYPVGDGRVAAWLVHRRADPAVPDDRVAEVQRAYAGLGPVVDRVLGHCGPSVDLYYDHVSQVHLDRWARGRTVLVGDACQAPSLMAGQGASMAMTGAWTLARELAAGGPVDQAVQRYVSAMQPFAAERQTQGRRSARWLVPSDPWRIVVRGLALQAARLPGAAALLRAAVGLQGERANELPG